MARVAERLLEELRTRGNSAPARVFQAPGRVNLIGEHTDYNLGFVMPIALDLACTAAIAPRADGILRIASLNLGETHEAAAADLASLSPRKHWSDYVIGTAREVLALGFPVSGADVVIESTVPVGAGLSSSAAIEVSSALAFLGGRSLDKMELVKLARRAENDFAGMPCGIMDQYISVFGEERHAIRIDCRDLSCEAVPLPYDVSVVAVNSMVKHELGSSAYANRVRECAEAVAVFNERIGSIESLRDVNAEQFTHWDEYIPETPRRRARHVIGENERVLAFRDACERHDKPEMGSLFYRSHKSMRDDYEISCEEIDFLVETAMAFDGCYGARMTGGGFGGCTVNLLRPDAVERFQSEMDSEYRKRFGITPVFYACHPAEGARELAIA
ncbi:MAG: galactokinase [Bryobacterales bacterium]|nr:galactokinase [Bryobacterales bacterium]